MSDLSNPDADQADDSAEKLTRADRKAKSRREIIGAARDVFFRDGFMSANLDEVAERASVAKGTLYRYFESKADLYVAVLLDDGNAFTERMREAVAPASSGVDQIQRIGDFYYDYWIRYPEYFQIFWAIDNQAVIGELPDQVVDAVSRLWEQNLRILSEGLERAVQEGSLIECDSWEIAHILWTTGNALIQSDAIKTRRELRRVPLDVVFRDSIRFILRGLAAPGSNLFD